MLLGQVISAVSSACLWPPSCRDSRCTTRAQSPSSEGPPGQVHMQEPAAAATFLLLPALVCLPPCPRACPLHAWLGRVALLFPVTPESTCLCLFLVLLSNSPSSWESFATRMEDWTCLGQHKRQPEFPGVTRESRRNSKKTTWLFF